MIPLLPELSVAVHQSILHCGPACIPASVTAVMHNRVACCKAGLLTVITYVQLRTLDEAHS